LLGLLAKAHQLRDRLTREGRLREDITFDSQSGISREDQREIMKEIETVATRSRIEVTPEVFVVRAVKRGILFPIVVNIVTILVLGIGAAGLYFLFQRGETQISREQPAAITVEGQLLAEMKKEAEARLQEKSREINQIQDRLAQIDKERQDLQDTMDTKVSEREKELRAAMAKELEDERQRLKNQGLSEETINTRIQALEAQKNTQYADQLDAYKKQADEERRKSEESLQKLEQEFNANLATVNAERQQVLAESQKREEDLRAQLEQKTQALESAKTKAEQDLMAIAAQREKEDLAIGQLIGLYEVAKTDIERRDYDKALLSLKAVGDFVNRTDVSVLPVMTKRREFDLFVVDSLTGLVQSEREQSQVDTATLLTAAGQIADIRAHVSDADALLQSGRPTEAQKAYGEALQVVPDISRSFAYLSQREREAEANRQVRVRGALGRAEAAFGAGRLAEALSSYREAFSYLPEISDRLDSTMESIQAVGFTAGMQKSRQEQSRSAAPLLAQADTSSANAKPRDAIASYAELLATYPLSIQAGQAVKGIGTQMQKLTEASSDQQKSAHSALSDQIATLQKNLAARQADVSRIKRDIAGLIGESGDPEKADVDALFESLRSKYTSLAAGRSGAEQSQQKLADDLRTSVEERTKLLDLIDSLKVELEKAQAASTTPKLGQADFQLLMKLQERVAGLDKSYKGYTSLEDPVLAGRGLQALVDTKAYLDSFLASKPVEETFPGLLARIKRYDQGFQSAGRTDALKDVLDVVIELTQSSAPDARQKLFQEKRALYRQDKDMTALLNEIQRILE
jgi:hypothetical protein